MGSLEDRAPNVLARAEDPLFRGRADISREEEGNLPHGDPQHERAFIGRGGRPGLPRTLRVQGFDDGLSFPMPEAPGDLPPGHGARQGLDQFPIALVLRCRRGFPKFPDAEVPGDGRQPSQVVGVRVGEDQDVDPPDALGPNKRGHHSFADVEGAADEPPSVDEHFAAAREFDEERLSLPDVDHRYLEVGGRRRERVEDEEQKEQPEGRQDERPLPSEARPGQGEAEEQEVSGERPGARRRHPVGQKEQGVQEMG